MKIRTFLKKSDLETFANFNGKELALPDLRPGTSLKRDSNTSIFL